jgi:hypothetical protein
MDYKRPKTVVEHVYSQNYGRRTTSRGVRSKTAFDYRAIYKQRPVYTNMSFRSASTTTALIQLDKKKFQRPKNPAKNDEPAIKEIDGIPFFLLFLGRRKT